MIRISGNVERIDRIKVVPPVDGVHVASKDGYLRGCHSLLIDGVMVPKGMVGFYWNLGNGDGVKVYYGFKNHCVTSESTIMKIRKLAKKLAVYGVCKPPHGICTVKLDLRFEGKRIKKTVKGLVVRHVNYPPDIWFDYMKGNPYNWNGLDQAEHPEHNPEGFLKFAHSAIKVVKKLGLRIKEIDRIGNTVYDTVDKRWFLVDIG